MIYKTLIVRTRTIAKSTAGPHPYAYTSEEHAYSDYQYFSSLTKAQEYMQWYSPEPLVWEPIGDDCWTAKTDVFSANIYVEGLSNYDSMVHPALPSKFAGRPDRD